VRELEFFSSVRGLWTSLYADPYFIGWLGSRVVSMLDSGAEGPGFKVAVATLSGNSLRQTVHTHRASVHQAAKLVAALLRVAGVTAGLADSNGGLPPGFMTHVTCRLTARNRDQLRNPTLDNRAWATFTLCTSLHFTLLTQKFK